MKSTTSIAIIIFSLLSGIFISCSSTKKKTTYQEKTYQELKKELKEASVSIVNDSIRVLFPNNLLFKTGSAEVNTTIEPTLERFANVLNKYKKTSILINGYTDNTGDYEVNKVLSENRALNVRKKLLNNNVKASRLHSWGHGHSNPIGDNNTESGREKNRRVEFIVLYKYK